MRPPNGVILHEIYEYPQFPYSHRTSGAEEVLAASAADEAVTSCVAAQRNIKLVKTMNCVTVIVSRVSATIARCGDHRSPCNIYLLINSTAITTIPPANKHRSRRNVTEISTQWQSDNVCRHDYCAGVIFAYSHLR